ncbi:pyrroline-5-carboxylate reductase 2-like isoform X2 [Leptidea sinapis]|nr:pyrroline-5-carboxylate reductase 2-like isoform X2 [Leptidea sinapis]VVC92559.1 unnamed protein product [Leptidea sinapis]
MLTKAVADCIATLPEGERDYNRKVLVVSILAGISLVQLQKSLKILPGKISIIRALPNTPMSVGAGVCLYTPDDTVTQNQCSELEHLMSGCGICERVPEYLMSSLGSLIGCGPAFIFIAIEALADGAVKKGAPRALAQRLAAHMVMGSGKMVTEHNKHPGLLKDEVCSPGGSTIHGLSALENGKFRATLIAALEAATDRTDEMGKQS